MHRLDDLPHGVNHDLIPLYRETVPNTIAVLQNSNDDFHIKNHLTPLAETMADTAQLKVRIEDWGGTRPHRNRSSPRFCGLLLQCPRRMGNGARSNRFCRYLAMTPTFRIAVYQRSR